MNMNLDDIYKLHSSRPADFNLLANMPTLDTVETTADGSTLAVALLGLPNAFSESTATLILDAVPLAYCDQTIDLEHTFETLAEREASEQNLEELDADGLELVLDMWLDDQDAAAIVFQDFQEYLREQRDLGEMEALKLLRSELESKSADVTVGQLLLLMNETTGATARYVFPEARDMFDILVSYEPELTPAEKRRKDRRDRLERNRIAGAGNRRRSDISDLENMIMLEEDPIAIAAMALNTSNVKDDQLLDILEHAETAQIRDWLFGRELNFPKPGQIADLMQRLTADRVEELIESSHSMLEELAEGGQPVSGDLPYVFEIIEHVYMPRVLLSPATATVVHHELSQRIGDDPSIWTAVLMADTGDEPVRFSDLVL